MVKVGDDATIALSGIGTEINEDILRDMYRTYGPILRIRHNGTNSAHIVFKQRKHAMNAVKATNGSVVYGKTIKAILLRIMKKTTNPCRSFAAGICRMGDQCKYYHVTDDARYANFDPVAANPPRIPKIKTVKVKESKPAEPVAVPSVANEIPPAKLCRHFSRGFCAKGSACTFAHVMGLPKDSLPSGKAAKLCQFFVNGLCDRGDACMYVHPPQADPVPKTAATDTVVTKTKEESETIPEQVVETRVCIECEKPGIAVWQCEKCDNSLYCDACNLSVHRARVMAKHKQIKLSPARIMPLCGECESSTASVQCEQCDVPFCASCDTTVHKFKSLQKHRRTQLLDVLATDKLPKKAEELTLLKQDEKMTSMKKSKAKSVPVANIGDPVPYVESIPQLEFSSDSSESSDSSDSSNSSESSSSSDSSDSENEEYRPRTAIPSEDEARSIVKASVTESEEDFEDVKPKSSKLSSARKEKCKSKDFIVSKSTLKSSFVNANESKRELSYKLKSSKNEDSRPTSAPLSASEIELSSEFDENPHRKADAKLRKKSKTAGLKATSAFKKRVVSNSDTSDFSEDEDSPVTASVKPPKQVQLHSNKGGISDGSSHTLVKKIEDFLDSTEHNELHLDANLNGFERLLAHDCAERLGLAHESVGSGLERHIVISRYGTKRAAVDTGYGHKSKKVKRRH
ncbi:putative B-box-type zinc finger, R3H domain, U2 auxiliary factor small subunit [Plasmopara halstedii]